ncbi:MAG: DEAD/DEAH box helicase [Betaproteobacteria bacterium]|nr:DEAD/DEAH box helicase [Betaproteobacteria bacterium]
MGIMTGDIKFCPDAQIVIMTTEILRNLLYKKGSTTEHLGLTASLSMDGVDAIVFDECHYINDKDRGKVWEETMILLPPSVSMIMLSATLDHPEYLAQWLGELKQKPIHLIQTHYRMVPLTHYVLGKEDKMILLMDPKENYKREAYRDWHRGYHTLQKEVQTFQQKVVDSRQSGIKGAVGGKVHGNHPQPQSLKALAKVKELASLGIKSACDISRSSAGLGHRKIKNRCRASRGWHRRLFGPMIFLSSWNFARSDRCILRCCRCVLKRG